MGKRAYLDGAALDKNLQDLDVLDSRQNAALLFQTYQPFSRQSLGRNYSAYCF